MRLIQTAVILLTIAFIFSACAKSPATPQEESPLAQAPGTPKPAASVTLIPEHDYGRDRTGEYVYTEGELFHEIECEALYGELSAIEFAKAKSGGLVPCTKCKVGGSHAKPEFKYNPGFERTMQAHKKINIKDANTSYDLIYITTGDDVFDINNLHINNSVRVWYKEFGIDPGIIRVYVKNGDKTYHNALCEIMATTNDKDFFLLTDAFASNIKPCANCLPPSKTWTTMPIKAPDLVHFYYANSIYITQAIKAIEEGVEVPPEMNLDIERMLNGYYD